MGSESVHLFFEFTINEDKKQFGNLLATPARLKTAPTGCFEENRDYRFKYLNFIKLRLPGSYLSVAKCDNVVFCDMPPHIPCYYRVPADILPLNSFQLLYFAIFPAIQSLLLHCLLVSSKNKPTKGFLPQFQ